MITAVHWQSGRTLYPDLTSDEGYAWACRALRCGQPFAFGRFQTMDHWDAMLTVVLDKYPSGRVRRQLWWAYDGDQRFELKPMTKRQKLSRVKDALTRINSPAEYMEVLHIIYNAGLSMGE